MTTRTTTAEELREALAKLSVQEGSHVRFRWGVKDTLQTAEYQRLLDAHLNVGWYGKSLGRLTFEQEDEVVRLAVAKLLADDDLSTLYAILGPVFRERLDDLILRVYE